MVEVLSVISDAAARIVVMRDVASGSTMAWTPTPKAFRDDFVAQAIVKVRATDTGDTICIPSIEDPVAVVSRVVVRREAD